MSNEPHIAGNQPIPVEVEEGKMYWWCACGQSKKQPFCDGSHKGTEFVPQGSSSAPASARAAARFVMAATTSFEPE